MYKPLDLTIIRSSINCEVVSHSRRRQTLLKFSLLFCVSFAACSEFVNWPIMEESTNGVAVDVHAADATEEGGGGNLLLELYFW